MDPEQEIYDLLLKLLHAIRTGDSNTYKQLVSEDLTCFEPETQGSPVDGLSFHLFFMDNMKHVENYHIEVVRPTIRVLGDMAYVAYTLIQTTSEKGVFDLTRVNETRIFRKYTTGWKMIHFHRSI